MTVILLNGVGSAGKSSIAGALQKILAGVWLHISMDAFIAMLPEHLQDDPSTFSYRNLAAAGAPPEIGIEDGEAGQRLLHGMRRAVAAMANAGNDLIVDDVLIGDGLADYERLLAGQHFLKIAIIAPLDILEAREAGRSDRMPGLARWQFPRVHAGIRYDLQIDTDQATPMACAGRIADHLKLARRVPFHI